VGLGRSSIRISAGTPSNLIAALRVFSQSLQEDAGIVPRLSHHRFLPDNFQFIRDDSSYHPRVYTLDTEISLNKNKEEKHIETNPKETQDAEFLIIIIEYFV
jgi:hypothetical protein